MDTSEDNPYKNAHRIKNFQFDIQRIFILFVNIKTIMGEKERNGKAVEPSV